MINALLYTLDVLAVVVTLFALQCWKETNKYATNSNNDN